MNQVILMGRLTKEPEINTMPSGKGVARYTLACPRDRKSNNGDDTDFIFCTTFDRGAEFAERYLHKGTKIIVTGQIRTGSYKNQEGKTIYTTEVVVRNHEFCESKSASAAGTDDKPAPDITGFLDIPNGIDFEVPFE